MTDPATTAADEPNWSPPATDGSMADAVGIPEALAAEVSIDAVDLGLGLVRVGVGAALLIAPRWAGRIWVGPGADGPGSLVFARALGARDVVLGLRILEAVKTGEPSARWVTAGFAADAADLTATMIAGRQLEGPRRVVMPLVAGAVGVLGAWSARRASAEAA